MVDADVSGLLVRYRNLARAFGAFGSDDIHADLAASVPHLNI